MKTLFKVIALFIVLTGIGAIGYSYYSKSKGEKVEYETARVERGNLRQSVEVTGNVESAQDLSLHFETVGTVANVNVKEGDTVKAAVILANLRMNELEAAVAQARANLNQKLAGSTREQIAAARAAADAAKAALDQARLDTANSVAASESALETARNNLRLAEGGDNSRIVNEAYEDAVTLLQATLPVLDDALTQADNILGVDNTLANDSFENYLSARDPNKLPPARLAYSNAKAANSNVRNSILPLASGSAHVAVDGAMNFAEDALTRMSQLLSSVSEVLGATPPTGALTQTALDAQKTTIQTTRTAVSTKYTSLVAQRQAISAARNSYETYRIAHEKAARDLTNARAVASTTVAAKEAAHNQALANWRSLANPPRAVDVAPLRAALAQAEAERDKAILKAPMDGLIAKVNKKIGELVIQADEVVKMISPHYQIKIDVPETDVAKLQLNDSATITMDAFGAETALTGKIVNIESASTEIQDVVYYKVTMALDATETPIKAGMTANVTIIAAERENVLFIPFRAVRDNGGKFVRVLENGAVRELPVNLGLRADDGKVEILGGLNEGQEVVVSVRQ